jgi:hypothetical protein
MASRIALEIVAAVMRPGTESSSVKAAARTDEALQEVREVVKLVAHPKFDAGGDGIHYYVTKADIERARALMLKLEVRP